MIGGGRGTDGMVNKMGSANEDGSKGGDNRGRRWETAEDGSEPSETDEDKWDGWKTGQNCRGEAQKAGKMEGGGLGAE